MALVPYDRVRDISFPEGAIVEPYVNSVCLLRRATPWLFQPVLNQLPAFPPTAIPGQQAFWDNLCAPVNPPSAPFVRGGQCLTDYRTDAIVVRKSDNQEVDASISPTLPGPIVDAGFIRDDTETQLRIKAFIRNQAGQYREATNFTVRNNPEDWDVFYFVRRLDGLPDDCGDREPYPVPPSPPSLPIPLFVPLVNGQVIPVNVNLPVFNTNNWPDFTFEPTFEIGPFEISFTPEGIVVPDEFLPDWPPSPLPDVNLAPTLNAIADVDASLSVQFSALSVELGNVDAGLKLDLSKIEELIRRCCCKEGQTLQVYPISGETSGGTFLLDPKTVAVVIEVVPPFTAQTPMQAGSGAAPDVWHWGWHSVGYAEATAGTRVPLQHGTQSIAVEPEGVSITVSPHYGNTCTIKGYKLVEMEA